MKDMVLLGDEALALGAIHAGLSAGFGYPGTPSTEILEYLIDNHEKHTGPEAEWSITAQWCANEKTAYEAALGVSFLGRRSIVTMKHVGLNVAADPFMNSSLLGIKGGLIIAVADDPGMHSSQGEQDTRFYADFAMVPCFEPTTQQEAYEMAAEAFDVSEKYQVPVIMRMVTRLAHSRAVVHTGSKIRPENPIARGNPPEWMLLPALARKNYEKMIAKQPELLRWAEGARWNSLEMNSGRDDLAIITSGLGRNYYLENLDDYREFCGNRGLPAVVHVGTLPLPEEKILRLAETASRILVIEEGMPFIEKQLRGILPQNILPGKTEIIGKYTGHLPRAGELNPELVRKALGMPPVESVLSRIGEEPLMEGALPGRPPQLCKGCPHGDSYRALNKAVAELAGRDGTESVAVCADIGCYALGAVPPYNAVETIVCMGASIGMARGASLAGCTYTAGVIGDSTFLHSGITNLIDAVSDKTPVTVIILDNSIVAMTGCQETILPSSQLEPLVRGVGVEPEHIRVLSATPADIDKNAGVIREELEYRGVSVIIMVRECLEAFRLRQKAERAAQAGGAAK